MNCLFEFSPEWLNDMLMRSDFQGVISTVIRFGTVMVVYPCLRICRMHRRLCSGLRWGYVIWVVP